MMMEDQLLKLLNELEAAAKSLQACLLSRDAGRIWSALARQEQSVEKLDALQKGHPEWTEQAVRGNPPVRKLLARSRSVVQTNRMLAQRFLDVVGETLSRLGGGSAPTYTGYGTPVRRSAPLLVCQQG